MERVEITKELFNRIVTSDTKVDTVKETEHYRHYTYIIDNTVLVKSDSFSGYTNHYVYDINN